MRRAWVTIFAAYKKSLNVTAGSSFFKKVLEFVFRKPQQQQNVTATGKNTRKIYSSAKRKEPCSIHQKKHKL